MTHPVWYGEDCIQCSNFDKHGDPQPSLCMQCDSYIMNFIEDKDLDELQPEIVLDLLKAYDKYIQDNADNNAEFGHSWMPVCINEFLKNEYIEELCHEK